MRKPWIVQRAGSPGAYLPGWFATDWIGDSGAVFPTWREAFDFAEQQVRDRDPALTRALAQWGVQRVARPDVGPLPPMGTILIASDRLDPVPAPEVRKPGNKRRSSTAPKGVNRQGIALLVEQGWTAKRIAAELGITPQAVGYHLRKLAEQAVA